MHSVTFFSLGYHWLHVFPRLALALHFPALGVGCTFTRTCIGYTFFRGWHWLLFFPRLVLAGYFSGLGGSCVFATLGFVFISSAWLVELLRLPGFVLRQTKKGEAAEMFLSNLRNCASCLLEKLKRRSQLGASRFFKY